MVVVIWRLVVVSSANNGIEGRQTTTGSSVFVGVDLAVSHAQRGHSLFGSNGGRLTRPWTGMKASDAAKALSKRASGNARLETRRLPRSCMNQ